MYVTQTEATLLFGKALTPDELFLKASIWQTAQRKQKTVFDAIYLS
jgi:hypothetical protein